MVSHGGFHPAVVEPVNDVGVEQFAKDTGDPHELWPVLAGWLVDSRGHPHPALVHHGSAHGGGYGLGT